jgi:DNA-binding NarL/FixJ family response regulator
VVAAVRLYREGMATNISGRAGLSMAGAAASAAEAVALAVSSTPEVAIVDMAMQDALDLIRTLAREAPATRVIAFAIDEHPGEIVACAEAGAAGYVPCDGSMDDVARVIDDVIRGDFHCSPEVAGVLLRRVGDLARAAPVPTAVPTLTARQQEILSLIERGLSNKEIAVRLNIGVATVKNHVHQLFERLQVGTRTEAAALHGQLARRPAPPRELRPRI